jgi:4'-phosphopantetheinyl transferase
LAENGRVRVHLYTAVLDRVDPIDRLRGRAARARLERLLSDDERASRDRLLFEGNQREYLYAHALLRVALSRHAPGVAPESWRFSRGPLGKPAVAWPVPSTPLHFNLSHTRGVVACAISDEALVGVDVEATDHADSALRVATSFFAPREVQALRLSPPRERADLFLRYWTLKESYLKGRGVGLSLRLDQFWFDLPPDESGTTELGGVATDALSWRFAERRPTPEHRLAVAVGAMRRAAWTIDLTETQVDDASFGFP